VRSKRRARRPAYISLRPAGAGAIGAIGDGGHH
jgi:hypothetical protein